MVTSFYTKILLWAIFICCTSFYNLSTQITGKKTDEPSPEKAEQVFSNEGIHYGANNLVIAVLIKLGELAEEQKDVNMAKHYYTMIYKLQRGESVKEKLDQLYKPTAPQ